MKKQKTGIYAVTGSVLLFLLSSTTSLAEKDETRVGKHLFRAYCFVCHGYDSKGHGPLARKLGFSPADLTAEKYQKMNIDELAKIISGYGRKPGSMMPKWGDELSKESVRAIASYIPLLSKKDPLVSGDVRRGYNIFRFNCIPCHGLKGRGDGVIAKLLKLKMPDFKNRKTLKRNTDQAILNLIKAGSPGMNSFMPSWAGILSKHEIIDVATYVRALRK